MRSVEDHPGPALSPEHNGDYDDVEFLEVIVEVGRLLEYAGIPFAFMGGLASTMHGRPRWTHDVDVFVKPQDALHALDQLKVAGFRTERTDDDWLYKAFKKKVMVDIIFKSRGSIYFDDEMHSRTVVGNYRGAPVRFVPPEDLVVIKAAVADEVGPHHWHDALSVLTSSRIDWEYLLRRSRAAPRRVLALLLYAQSEDLMVPNSVIRQLFHDLFDS